VAGGRTSHKISQDYNRSFQVFKEIELFDSKKEGGLGGVGGREKKKKKKKKQPPTNKNPKNGSPIISGKRRWKNGHRRDARGDGGGVTSGGWKLRRKLVVYPLFFKKTS